MSLRSIKKEELSAQETDPGGLRTQRGPNFKTIIIPGGNVRSTISPFSHTSFATAFSFVLEIFIKKNFLPHAWDLGLCMLLQLSQLLQRLARAQPELRPALQQLHAWRYGYFVRNSPRGTACRYAQATAKQYEASAEAEVIRTLLTRVDNKEIVDEITHCL